MPSTKLLLFGNNVLDGANVNTRSNGGFEGKGQATIRNGDMPFDKDDIVVIEVDNAAADLQVTGQSRIVGIRVYDSATDYYYDKVKYTYGPMNPNQYANIQSDVSGLGDQYLRFNANVLRSTDPGAPRINQLFVGAGIDLSGVAQRGETVVISRIANVDFNGNSRIDGGTTENGDGFFNTENNMHVTGRLPVCFCRGTLIDTPQGARHIETLKEGDLVTTLDHGAQPVAWIGRRLWPGTGDFAPVRIAAGALGNLRDLWVSQNHRMLIRGADAELLFGQKEVLVAAKNLVNDRTIRIVETRQVEYLHLLFDRHEIVFAEACPAESLFPGTETLKSVDAVAQREIVTLFPELGSRSPGADASRYMVKTFEAEALRRRAS